MTDYGVFTTQAERLLSYYWLIYRFSNRNSLLLLIKQLNEIPDGFWGAALQITSYENLFVKLNYRD